MANCKDCICVNVCSIADVMGEDYFCNGFKDRNRFIEFPCSVGDTVYYYNGDFSTILPYFVENLNIAYLNEKENCYTYEANCTNDDNGDLIDSLDFDLNDIGKTVFLTREEAEKALEGRSTDNETN